MNVFSKKVAALELLVLIILISGCMSPSNVNATLPITVTQQSTVVTTFQNFENLSPWIYINPIDDFHSESPFNITGTTQLIINGTTNFPAGSLFWVNIIEEDRSRSVLSNVLIPVEEKSDGSVTFSYTYDMKGNPPAHYRVEIRKANQNFTAIARFNITSREPWWWIHIDPVGESHKGENLTITGTTNLPVGSEISISTRMIYHSCPREPGPRTPFCNGTCSSAISQSATSITPGVDGKNIWLCIINTTEWCISELYQIETGVSNWTNVSGGRAYIRFRIEPLSV